MKNRAFTLIELLVVVLIIGILAAIALPQYQKAIIKSRVAAILPILKSVKDAEEIHYMANGRYTEDVSQLDIDLPAGCSSLAGGDGGLYKCDNWFLLDLDGSQGNIINRGKIIASYCPGKTSSRDDCRAVCTFEIRFTFAHNTHNNDNVNSLYCSRVTSEGNNICKFLKF